MKLIFSEESLKRKLRLKILTLLTTSHKNKLLADLEITEDHQENKVTNKEKENQEEISIMIEGLEDKEAIEEKEAKEEKAVKEDKAVTEDQTTETIDQEEIMITIGDQEEKKVIEDLEEKMETETTTDQRSNGLKLVPLNQERKD